MRLERGVATVPVVLILLLGLAIMGLYANRGLVFEQRTAANQARATQAFEIAEAGLGWALAMLNAPAAIGADASSSSKCAVVCACCRTREGIGDGQVWAGAVLLLLLCCTWPAAVKPVQLL